MTTATWVSHILRTRQVVETACVLPVGTRVGDGAQNTRAQLLHSKLESKLKLDGAHGDRHKTSVAVYACFLLLRRYSNPLQTDCCLGQSNYRTQPRGLLFRCGDDPPVSGTHANGMPGKR